jgi:class 3 adenylate cyclase/predicted ATPase
LPRHLVASISQNPTSGQVSGEFREGTALFADVSGFTAMSEKLSALGKEGAEEMTGVVNGFFEAMLEISDGYGGDLLKFGGDALLIFFEGEDGPNHALATGNTMQAAMSRFKHVETSQGVFSLRMSIGMGSGPVFLGSVGTADQMEFAVMGRTLGNMAQAESIAEAGQIVVDGATFQVTQDIASYKSADDGFWFLEDTLIQVEPMFPKELDQSQESPEVNPNNLLQKCMTHVEVINGLSAYVPEELLTRLIIDPQRPVLGGSHRPVTMMFANFYGVDEIIEALGVNHVDTITEILNTHFVTMNEILTRYGGTVSRLDAYAIGHRIMALFGALRAHEDDPQRAVRAASDMNNSLEEVNQLTKEILAAIPGLGVKFGRNPLKQRIGINTGFVFAGNVGSAHRREYTVMGDQVNLTARMMSVADRGEVLIGQSTARHAKSVFHLVEKEAVKVKGISESVRNYVVKGLRERHQGWEGISFDRIEGRELELIRGREAVDRSLSGDGCLLVIKGDSGIGKTRLAEEIALYGEIVGLELLVGTCLSYGKTMTYHPWGDILRAHFDIRPGDDTMNAQARVEAVQKGMAFIDELEWTPVIGSVLGLDITDNNLTRDLDTKLRRQRVLDLIVKLLLKRAEQKPLVLAIDDAHWADPASLDAISYVARNIEGHPILMILIHRPDEGLPEWYAQPNAIQITTRGLTTGACRRIVQGLLGKVQLPESMWSLILDKAEGNPFFLTEVVRALIDARALEQDVRGNWRVVEDMTGVDLPDTIHGIIISRIDRLFDLDRRLLQMASVVGRVFEFFTLSGLYADHEQDEIIRERLGYLGGLGLTELREIELEIYRFIHLTTRDVVYESLSYRHRRDLHRRIGGFIERTYAETLSEKTDLLAYHYFEGQAWEKALEFNLQSARRAQLEYANDTAIAFCQRALVATTRISPQVDILVETLSAHELLGEVLTLVGRYDEAEEQYTSARKLVEREVLTPDKVQCLVELYRKTADVYERRSEYDQAFEWLEKGLGYLDVSVPSLEAVRIYLLGAGLYHRQVKNDQAIDWCQKSLDLADQIHSREGQQAMAQAYYVQGAAYYRLGELEHAVEHCQKSIRAYEEISDFVGQARAYNNLAIAYSDLGAWTESSQAYDKSLAMNERIGNVQEQGFVANNLANIYMYRGEWDMAIARFKESNAIWKKIGAALPDAVTLSNLAQVYIYQEAWHEALDCLSESEDLFTEIGSGDFLPELERRWGEYYLKTGELNMALERASRSMELAAEQEARLELGMSFRVLGEVHMARGEYDAADVALHRSYRILVDMNSEYQAAKTMLSLSYLAINTGKAVDREQLELARASFKKLGAQADLEKTDRLAEQLSG